MIVTESQKMVQLMVQLMKFICDSRSIIVRTFAYVLNKKGREYPWKVDYTLFFLKTETSLAGA